MNIPTYATSSFHAFSPTELGVRLASPQATLEELKGIVEVLLTAGPEGYREVMATFRRAVMKLSRPEKETVLQRAVVAVQREKVEAEREKVEAKRAIVALQGAKVALNQ